MLKTNCATELANIGSLSCDINNKLSDIVSIILTKDTFFFASIADAVDKTKFEDYVRSKDIIPIHDIFEMDDQSEESQYYESPTGLRIPGRLGKNRLVFRFNKPFEVHKALQSYRGKKFRMMMLDSSNNLIGYSPDGVKFGGLALSMFNPEKLTMPGQDNTPAWTSIAVDIKDSKELNEKGYALRPGFFVTDILPVSTVEISVVSAIATKVVLKVGYFNGFAGDGSDDLVGISGILQDDFVFTGTTPTAAAMVDNGDGTYDFPGVGMVSGTVELKPPTTATTVGDPIETVGDPVAITIA